MAQHYLDILLRALERLQFPDENGPVFVLLTDIVDGLLRVDGLTRSEGGNIEHDPRGRLHPNKLLELRCFLLDSVVFFKAVAEVDLLGVDVLLQDHQLDTFAAVVHQRQRAD